jgi:hypothetical protein
MMAETRVRNEKRSRVYVNRLHVRQIGRHQRMHRRKAGGYLCTLHKVTDAIPELLDPFWWPRLPFCGLLTHLEESLEYML